MSAGDVSCTAPATRNASLQILPACHRVCACYKTRTFLTFCFETCFAPQQRALFLHLNFGREVVPESRKMRRVLSHLAGGEIKNRRLFWREAALEVKMVKTHHSRSTFGSRDVEKADEAVVRGTFGSKIGSNTSFSEHLWKLR